MKKIQKNRCDTMKKFKILIPGENVANLVNTIEIGDWEGPKNDKLAIYTDAKDVARLARHLHFKVIKCDENDD